MPHKPAEIDAYLSSPARLFDPRPDLESDHDLWTALLGVAWVRDPATAGVLHGVRCEGARLERDKAFGLRLARSEDLAQPEWDARRQRWLAPRREAVVQLLRAAAEVLDRRPGEAPVEVPPDRILPIAVPRTAPPSGRAHASTTKRPYLYKGDYGKPAVGGNARG